MKKDQNRLDVLAELGKTKDASSYREDREIEQGERIEIEIKDRYTGLI